VSGHLLNSISTADEQHWYAKSEHKNRKIAPSCDSYLKIICIVFYALYSMHCILCIVFYALYYMQRQRKINKPFLRHGKLRWIGNILALWTNKVLHFQKKVMMDLILQIIIALNQLNDLLSFLCFLRALEKWLIYILGL
jgi:hypothetical protein